MVTRRHPVTTQQRRTSALHQNPQLFRFAFFANIAADRPDGGCFSAYNEGQLVQHADTVLDFLYRTVNSAKRFFRVRTDSKWQPGERNFKSISNSFLAYSVPLQEIPVVVYTGIRLSQTFWRLSVRDSDLCSHNICLYFIILFFLTLVLCSVSLQCALPVLFDRSPEGFALPRV